MASREIRWSRALPTPRWVRIVTVGLGSLLLLLGVGAIFAGERISGFPLVLGLLVLRRRNAPSLAWYAVTDESAHQGGGMLGSNWIDWRDVVRASLSGEGIVLVSRLPHPFRRGPNTVTLRLPPDPAERGRILARVRAALPPGVVYDGPDGAHRSEVG